MTLRAPLPALFVAAALAACGPDASTIAETQTAAFGALQALDARETAWRETLDAFAQGRRTAGEEPCRTGLVDGLGLQPGDLEFMRADELPELSSTALDEAAAALRVALAELLVADGVDQASLDALAEQTTAATSTLGVEALWLVQELGYPTWSATEGLQPGVFRGVLLVYDHDTEAAMCAASVRETNAPDVIPERDTPEREAFEASPEAFLLADLRTQAFLTAADSFFAVPAR